MSTGPPIRRRRHRRPGTRCPVVGCVRKIPRRYLMCRRHWLQVPAGLQAAVKQHYCHGQEWGAVRPTLLYLRAARAALDAAGPVQLPLGPLGRVYVPRAIETYSVDHYPPEPVRPPARAPA